MTELTHLELLSHSHSETKGKLPFSSFYGNATQEDFFSKAIYGSLDSAVNLMKESHSNSRQYPTLGEREDGGPA